MVVIPAGDYSRRIKPGDLKCILGGGARSLTYIRLFVVLDEFGELKVSCDDRHLTAETHTQTRSFKC